jgi:hypothetical protein
MVGASSIQLGSGMMGLAAALCTTGAGHCPLTPDAQDRKHVERFSKKSSPAARYGGTFPRVTPHAVRQGRVFANCGKVLGQTAQTSWKGSSKRFCERLYNTRVFTIETGLKQVSNSIETMCDKRRKANRTRCLATILETFWNSLIRCSVNQIKIGATNNRVRAHCRMD